MKRLLMMFACLLCLVLNASIVSASPIVEKGNPPDSQKNSSLVKGFRPPRGGFPKKKPKSQPPKGSHDKNQRESNRDKHENADARRQREQNKAEEKRERDKSRHLWE